MAGLYTVGQLSQRVAAILTGIELDNVNDLYGAYQNAITEFLQKAAIPECTDRQPVTVYDGVYDYQAAPGIFGTQIIDFRPQGMNRAPWDTVAKKPPEEFDRMKQVLANGTEIAFEYRKGVQIMRIGQNQAQASLSLDLMTDTAGWVAGGGATNLSLDSTVYYQNSGSLRFNLAAGQSQGTLTKSIQSVDLTTYQGVGVIFLAVQLPSATAISSIGINIGSDAEDYYTVSASTGFLGAFVANDWLLIALNLANATQTGSPVITEMDYVQVFFDYNGTQLNNVRAGALFIALPYDADLLYQTPNIFLPSGSSLPQLTITNDTDTLILSPASYMIYQYECASAVAIQQGGGIASVVVATIHSKLYGARSKTGAVIEMGLYDLYRGANPSQNIMEVGNWYN